MDTTERRAHLDVTIDSTTYAKYQTEDTLYIRTESPTTDGPTYRARQQALILEGVSGKKYVSSVLTSITYGEATVDRAEGQGTITVTMDVSAVNGTTVDRPGWVDRAASS